MTSIQYLIRFFFLVFYLIIFHFYSLNARNLRDKFLGLPSNQKGSSILILIFLFFSFSFRSAFFGTFIQNANAHRNRFVWNLIKSKQSCWNADKSHSYMVSFFFSLPSFVHSSLWFEIILLQSFIIYHTCVCTMYLFVVIFRYLLVCVLKKVWQKNEKLYSNLLLYPLIII